MRAAPNGSSRKRRTHPIKRKKPAKSRRSAIVIAAVAFVVLTAAGGLFAWSLLPGAVPGTRGEVVHFRVEAQDKGSVIDSLASEGLLASPLLTRLYAVALTPGAQFKARSHLLTRGITARELIQRLAEVGSRASVDVTIPEGWTHMEIATRLEEKQVCSELGFQSAVFEESLVSSLAIPADSAEGYLFPATYRFALDTDPADVVRRLVAESRKRWTKLGLTYPISGPAAEAGLSPHDVVTLASIVEKETGRATESPRVARVFLNRLLLPEAETRGRLQSDPTAGYGCRIDPLIAPSCAKYTGTILPAMLDDAANPYNTYRHPGLPPGPICNPGERSIHAVLQPGGGRELYFVADGSGAHVFSTNYADHLKAVERLRAKK